MKLPNKINVIGREIDIIYGSEELTLDRSLGECEVDFDRIKIATKKIQDNKSHSLSRQQQKLALLHELFHVCFGILDHRELYDNEQVINQLAEMWYQIIEQLGGKDENNRRTDAGKPKSGGVRRKKPGNKAQ